MSYATNRTVRVVEYDGDLCLMPSLYCSKFWRERCREDHLLSSHLPPTRHVHAKDDKQTESESHSPRTKIRYLCATNSAVKKFLRAEERKVQSEIERNTLRNNEESLANLYYRLGTFLEFLCDKLGAYKAYEKALQFEEDKGLPENASEENRNLYLSCLQRVALELSMTSCNDTSKLAPSPIASTTITVDRVPYGSITYSQFLETYGNSSRPVVFSNASAHMLHKEFDWSLEGIANSCLGPCAVTPKLSVPHSCEWAEFEDSRSTTIKEFIQRNFSASDSRCDSPRDKRHEYIVDWSIPQHCPRFLEELDILTFPSLCRADWLQDTPPGSLYRDSWPSLFIGPAGTKSGLHVDASATNFWMLLIEGRKEWTFFNEQELPQLKPSFPYSLQPVFPHDAIATTPAVPVVVELKAGDLLFVPANSPHAVKNLSDTIAISGNFVDESNVEKSIHSLRHEGLTNKRASELMSCLVEMNRSERQRTDIRAVADSKSCFAWRDVKRGSACGSCIGTKRKAIQ